MTFGNVIFHLPIGLPLCEAIQIILEDLAIHGGLIFLYNTQSSAKRRKDDLIFSGRSLIKIRKGTEPKTDPWGTSDRTGTGSEAWPANATF